MWRNCAFCTVNVCAWVSPERDEATNQGFSCISETGRFCRKNAGSSWLPRTMENGNWSCSSSGSRAAIALVHCAASVPLSTTSPRWVTNTMFLASALASSHLTCSAKPGSPSSE